MWLCVERRRVSVILDAFAKPGLRQVLCEGGPTLFGTLLSADCVDELCLTISPLIEAGGARRIMVGTPENVRRMIRITARFRRNTIAVFTRPRPCNRVDVVTEMLICCSRPRSDVDIDLFLKWKHYVSVPGQGIGMSQRRQSGNLESTS